MPAAATKLAAAADAAHLQLCSAVKHHVVSVPMEAKWPPAHTQKHIHALSAYMLTPPPPPPPPHTHKWDALQVDGLVSMKPLRQDDCTPPCSIGNNGDKAELHTNNCAAKQDIITEPRVTMMLSNFQSKHHHHVFKQVVKQYVFKQVKQGSTPCWQQYRAVRSACTHWCSSPIPCGPSLPHSMYRYGKKLAARLCCRSMTKAAMHCTRLEGQQACSHVMPAAGICHHHHMPSCAKQMVHVGGWFVWSREKMAIIMQTL